MGLGLPVSFLGFKPQMGLGSFLGFKTNWFMYSRLGFRVQEHLHPTAGDTLDIKFGKRICKFFFVVH